MNLNWFDFGVIGVVTLSTTVSFFRGFLRETVSLLTWIAGLIIALHFAPMASHWFNDIIPVPSLRYGLAFILLFLTVFIVGLLVNIIIKHGATASGLSFFDRILGTLFGAARGVLLVAVLLMFMLMTTLKNVEAITNSQLSPLFMPLSTWLNSFLPEQLQNIQKWITIDDNRLDPRRTRES